MTPKVGSLVKLDRGPFESYAGTTIASIIAPIPSKTGEEKPQITIIEASDLLYFQGLRPVDKMVVLAIWGKEALIQHKSRRLKLPTFLLLEVPEPPWKVLVRAQFLRFSF